MPPSKNQPCPCGSRSPYKRCCWIKDQFKESSIEVARTLNFLLSSKVPENSGKSALEQLEVSLGISHFKEVLDWVNRERIVQATATLNPEGGLDALFQISYLISFYRVLIREDHPSGTLFAFCDCPKVNPHFRCIHLDTALLYLWLSFDFHIRARSLHLPSYLKTKFKPFCDQLGPLLHGRGLVPVPHSPERPLNLTQIDQHSPHGKKLALDAILFCPPDFIPIIPTHHRNLQFTESLPPSLPLKENRSYRPSSSPSFHRFYESNSSINRGLNPLLFPKDQINRIGFTQKQNERLQKLQCSIQFSFNDGVVLTAHEIEREPHYSKAVPFDLLPSYHMAVRSDSFSRSPISEYRLFTLDPFPYSSGRNSGDRQIDQAEIALLRLLEYYFNKKSSKKPKLWIVDSQNQNDTRKALPIQSGKFHPDSPGRWKLLPDPSSDQAGESAILSYIPTPLDPQGLVFEGFELNFEKRTLTFHRLSAAILSMKQAQRAGISEVPGPPGTPAELATTFQLRSHIQSTLSFLDQILQYNRLSPIDRPPPQFISNNKIKNQIRVSRSGSFQIHRKFQIENEEIDLWSMPSSAAPILSGLEFGLAAFFGKEAISMASRSSGEDRAHDLKFLKHSGLFSLMLMETLSYILYQKGSDGRIFKKGKNRNQDQEFIKTLNKKMGKVYATLKSQKSQRTQTLDSTDPELISLRNFCSSKVTRLVANFVEEIRTLVERGNETIFTRYGEIELSETGRFFLEILYQLLIFVAEHHGIAPFLNGRKPLLSRFHPLSLCQSEEEAIEESHPHSGILDYQISLESTSPIQILHAFTPLMSRGIELIFDSQPLSTMEESDFQSRFHLNEFENIDEFPISGHQQLDWFELHPQVFFKGREVGRDELRQMNSTGWVEHQGKLYLVPKANLPKIRQLSQFWEKIQSPPKRRNPKSFEATLFSRIRKSQTLELLALRASGIEVTGGKRWQEICRFYDSLDNRKGKLHISSSIRATLKKYQEVGVQWLLDLYELGLGGILADDMGLGKTLQTLAFLDILRTRKPSLRKILIVVPTSLTYNWLQEAEKFTPKLPLKIFQSETKDEILDNAASSSEVFLCTYGLFLNHKELFKKVKWDIAIFDEAQNLKNIASQRTAVARELPAQFKLCLTGTPLENHLGEFYCLMDLAVSGCLGDYDDYRRSFISPEMLDQEKVLFLKLKAKPLVLRRTKKEILTDLPPKSETVVKLPFERKQEKIYRDIAIACNEKVRGLLKGSSVQSAQLFMLSALLRLRQTCSDPSSVPNVRYLWVPPKIKELAEALDEITSAGDSALVFTQFLGTFHRIQETLKKLRIKNFGIHGGTSRTQREKILREFQNSETGSVLLMTLKTGGVGLNLTKATYVFHIEPWWNPAVENQATDRAHRIGQDRDVKVFRYLMRDSVEEKIQILKDRKQKRFDALFCDQEDAQLVSSFSNIARPQQEGGSNLLTQADFEYLLS